MWNKYNSFSAFAKELENAVKKLEDSKKGILDRIWRYLQRKIKEKHWVYWDGWAVSTSSPNSPLKKKWDLQNSVNYITDINSTLVYSDKEWLAKIHEYWVTYKMTEKQRKYLFWVVFQWQPNDMKWWWDWMITIPARPIWRTIKDKEEENIQKIVVEEIKNIF